MAPSRTESRGLVWLTNARASERDDPYSQACRQINWDTLALPFISIKRLGLDSVQQEFMRLKKSLHAADKRLRAMIFTSPRAASITKNLIRELPQVFSVLEELPCFTLAGATADSAIRNGFKVELAYGKSAAELAQQILARESVGPLIFPCSQARRDALPDLLSSRGVQVEELTIYTTTMPTQEEVASINAAWMKRKPEVVTIFSPSAVDSMTTVLADLPWETTKLIAVGSSTAEALRAASFQVSGELESPTPASLARSLGTIPI